MTSPLLKNNTFSGPLTDTSAKVSRNPIWLILAFLLPFLGMWIGFAVCGVHPFGDRQMLYSDLREHYYPFLQEF
ncbi:MAG: hypothetical protein IJC19_03465, partial [Clostridia bacterium]|nr:hypothetical protein [Clostridia bacterium]